jgi:hypothetical protein
MHQELTLNIVGVFGFRIKRRKEQQQYKFKRRYPITNGRHLELFFIFNDFN